MPTFNASLLADAQHLIVAFDTQGGFALKMVDIWQRAISALVSIKNKAYAD